MTQLKCASIVASVQQHPRSFAERIAERSPKFRVFDLLKSQPNRLAKNFSDVLLGRALGAVLCYARAELR